LFATAASGGGVVTARVQAIGTLAALFSETPIGGAVLDG